MTIGLALSGGGSKGDFELGALRFLYDQGIRPDVVSSTSVGSVNAVKLVEGEDPADPDRGLPGLERLWESLQVNADMYAEESWLHDPDMDPRVRDVLTGRARGLGIDGPQRQGGRWGDLDPLIDLVTGVAFLVGDGAALLRSLNVVAAKARSLYNLSPIRNLLHSRVDLDAIAGWVAAGGRWRIAAVALESGRLRYVTETGAVLERDGSPVLWSGPLTPACEALQASVEAAEAEVRALQEDLAGAPPAQKPAIVRQIRAAQGTLATARDAYAACVAAQPPVPLAVDLREAVLASSTMPAIFRTVILGDETYVDGGVREILPVQAAVDAGADEVYAIAASPLTAAPKPPRSYAGAGMEAVLSRSMIDLLLNEVNVDDLDVRPRVGSPAPRIIVIAPDVEIHDTTTIDPGLIRINRDYGWMRAADVLAGVAAGAERWRSASDIALNRLGTWRAENRRFGQVDPTRLADGAPPPDPDAQAQVDAGKARLAQLLAARRAAGGPVPDGIDRWTSTLELHPWSADLDDAAFVAQVVPDRMTFGEPVQVSVTMRNTGTTTWSEATGHRLGSQAPQDNVVWGARHVLSAPVPPGGATTFTFTATPPPPPGAAFQWRMVREGVTWFGASSPLVQVVVEASSECKQLQAEINAATATIEGLRAAREQLDPRNPVDRIEIREINEQVQVQEQLIAAARARRAALGCP